MGTSRLVLYFTTIKYLKSEQLLFRLFYFIRNKLYNIRSRTRVVFEGKINFVPCFGSPRNINSSVDVKSLEFHFLNKSKKFTNSVDWNFSKHGKLWVYNLNYFEFLEYLSRSDGLYLIGDYISKKKILKDGFEPYPISVRGISWIKFLSRNRISDREINTFLFNDYCCLIRNLEYHILGNHLIENAFSLIFAGLFFKNRKFFLVGKKILQKELEEQILKDGVHFELSPMYHVTILHRLLDIYDSLRKSKYNSDQLFISLIEEKAIAMTSWLNKIMFCNGDLPHFNDSTNGNTVSAKELIKYGKELGIKVHSYDQFSTCGYRKWSVDGLELVFDVGNIGPDYQPGHAHADTFTFCLYSNGRPIIVDVGLSTYQCGERRDWERSTNAHNTIEVNQKSSSQVWDAFRVGNRAKCIIIEETNQFIKAYHTGYERMGIVHWRSFKKKHNGFDITDSLVCGKNKSILSKGFIHFYPDISLTLKNDTVLINDQLKIVFTKCEDIKIEIYEYAFGFNKLSAAQRITYSPAMLNAQIHLELLHQ